MEYNRKFECMYRYDIDVYVCLFIIYTTLLLFLLLQLTILVAIQAHHGHSLLK